MAAFHFGLIPSLPQRPIAECCSHMAAPTSNQLVVQEFNVWIQNVLALQYSGAEAGGWPDYLTKGLFDWF
jgi:hypothetical protein